MLPGLSRAVAQRFAKQGSLPPTAIQTAEKCFKIKCFHYVTPVQFANGAVSYPNDILGYFKLNVRIVKSRQPFAMIELSYPLFDYWAQALAY